MIVSDLNAMTVYPKIAEIIRHIMAMNPIGLLVGEHSIEGRDLFINRVSGTTRLVENSKSEIHKNYIDIHVVLRGQETLGYMVTPATELFMNEQAFTNDCELVEELEGEQFTTITENQFVVFYPGMWHRPMLCTDEPASIEKMVIKVKLDYLTTH